MRKTKTQGEQVGIRFNSSLTTLMRGDQLQFDYPYERGSAVLIKVSFLGSPFRRDYTQFKSDYPSERGSATVRLPLSEGIGRTY